MTKRLVQAGALLICFTGLLIIAKARIATKPHVQTDAEFVATHKCVEGKTRGGVYIFTNGEVVRTKLRRTYRCEPNDVYVEVEVESAQAKE